MKPLLLIVLMFTCTQLSFGQIRATTESGNKVLLFDDGTWQYEEKIVASVEKEAFKQVAVVATAVKVDSTETKTTDFKDVFYLPSPRLLKYFGEKGSYIRCKMSCSNHSGIVKIHFQWEIPLSDGTRYFGSFKAGTKITFHMLDGQKLDILIGEDGSIEQLEKYNYTTISGVSQQLTNEQIAILSAQSFRKIEVDWRKNPEVYNVELSRYLIEALALVL